MSKHRVVKLTAVRNEREHDSAKGVRRDMYERIGDIVRDAGDNISGYAFVAWGKDGRNYSVLKSGHPLMTRMVPAFVQDSLSQHVAVDLTKDELKR